MKMSGWRAHWLLCGAPCAVLLATLNPRLAERLCWTADVRCAAVFFIFLSAGVRMPRGALRAAWQESHTVVFIQCYGFVATPLLLKLITVILGTVDIHKDILQGMLSAACMPPAAAAGTVLARAGGAGRAGEAHAVLAAALGVVVAAPLTTLSLLCTSGVTTVEPMTRLPARSFASVLLPLALGRMLAAPLAGFTSKWRWDVCSEVLLLLLLYGSCCDALEEMQGPLQANDVLITVLLVLSTVCVNAALCRWLAAALLPPATRGACDVATLALMCAAHKSLAFVCVVLLVAASAAFGAKLNSEPDAESTMYLAGKTVTLKCQRCRDNCKANHYDDCGLSCKNACCG